MIWNGNTLNFKHEILKYQKDLVDKTASNIRQQIREKLFAGTYSQMFIKSLFKINSNVPVDLLRGQSVMNLIRLKSY